MGQKLTRGLTVLRHLGFRNIHSTLYHKEPNVTVYLPLLSYGIILTIPLIIPLLKSGGLLFPYYIGVIVALRDELGVLTDSTPVAGASAGSLIAATSKSGISEADLIQVQIDFISGCCGGSRLLRNPSSWHDSVL